MTQYGEKTDREKQAIEKLDQALNQLPENLRIDVDDFDCCVRVWKDYKNEVGAILVAELDTRDLFAP